MHSHLFFSFLFVVNVVQQHRSGKKNKVAAFRGRHEEWLNLLDKTLLIVVKRASNQLIWLKSDVKLVGLHLHLM